MNASNLNTCVRRAPKREMSVIFDNFIYFFKRHIVCGTFSLIFHGEARQFIIICLHSARGDSTCKYFLANETRCRVYEKLSRANVVIAVFN